MELKPYQQDVINDLERFLGDVQVTKDCVQAFHRFWTQHPAAPLQPRAGAAIEPYKDNVPGVPHVCVKVPTAGGKTFIACNALQTIFNAYDYDRPRAVVWLVPSVTILEQTLRNLRSPTHPYRQKINAHFGHRVAVLDKTDLLQGTGFNVTSVREQLTIMVFTFDSLRARKKEDRKVFQENGNLQSFESMIDTSDVTLGEVIKQLNPVAVVDESHNAESELSVDMLKIINPSFILDLTATPRQNSNIISFVDAVQLKREHMVKLPVIVYNRPDKTEVINVALQLRQQLERQAEQEEVQGGAYIRPIVLFQAQPRSAADNTTFERLKEKLVSLNIPEEQIKIKTADLNEIKGIDLMSRECPVRYIITVNALKEGWDCPFAYVLASLADKSSAVDVEQILGRVLRQPNVTRHQFPMLNMSYVITASSKFLDTLDNIVRGLNKAGFSDKDYKVAASEELSPPDPLRQLVMPLSEPPEDVEEDLTADIDAARIAVPTDSDAVSEVVTDIEQTALQQEEAFEKSVVARSLSASNLPDEVQEMVTMYRIKDVFQEEAERIQLPQFYYKIQANDLMGIREEEVLLDKENLLKGFPLSKSETNIAFDSINSELYKVDLDETKREQTPSFVRLDSQEKESILQYLLDPSRKDSRVKNFTHRTLQQLKRIDTIPEPEIRKYLTRIFEDFTDEQFNDFVNNEYTYVDKIKKKIQALSEEYAEKKFGEMLDTDKVIAKPSFTLPANISPGDTSKDIIKSLYEKEGRMNGFEERVINEVGNMNNVAFWTRNIDRRGFRINGFINHYPDFIIRTKSGKTVLLETKGDHLDAAQKIKLGGLWASKSGNDYRYFMVYEKRDVEGAYTLEDFTKTINNL